MKNASYIRNLRFGGMALVLMLLLVSCGTNRNTESEDIKEFEEMRALVESREFLIENQWANPLSAGNINLIGNPNFIRFQKDSVDLFLPYFGVRHSGGGYNSEGGLKYEGALQNLEIAENEKNIRIKFDANQENENLNFTVTVFPNGNAHTSVTSSQRNTISYRGEIEDLPEKFKEE